MSIEKLQLQITNLQKGMITINERLILLTECQIDAGHIIDKLTDIIQEHDISLKGK